LFEPGQIVDRDPGQPGELFSAQPCRAAATADRDADRRGLDAVAPMPHRPTELPRVHLFTVLDADGLEKRLSWYWQSYENRTTR
jgi:hypothetical protein